MNKIIYLRTSTEEQNPELQLKDVKSLLNEGEEYELFKEQQSAFKDNNRSEFDKIKHLITKGVIKDLYVWDLDRLYRNRLKLISFFKLCKHKNVKIHSFRQTWLEDINKIPSPWGEMINDLLIQIMGWMGEEESAKKSERIKNAVRRKAGKTISYKGNKWGRKPLPKKTRDRILEAHKKGLSIRKIAETIQTSNNGNYKKISKSAIHKIIKDKENERK